MKNMTLKNMAQACHGELFGAGDDREAACVVMDSRKIEKGGVFIAAPGEKADGHDFIPAVCSAGALGVVCERKPEACDIPYILVKDSFQALKDIAEFYRQELTIPVVGITGSVGKTSTKEMIASVLSRKFCVLKTEGNYNNEIGLPLTVLGIRKEHEIAVLEMGISDFGEMHRLSRIAKPDICVITNIGQCHLENLGSREGILKAKSEIFDFMNPEGSILLNGDDDMLCTIREKRGIRPVHFGKGTSNEVYASAIINKGLLGLNAVIHMDGKAFPVEIPLPGEHMINNALAAAAVGRCLGLTIEQIQEGIAAVQSVGGRSHVMALRDYTVIDDCYNANPVSMKAAMELLCTAEGRKTAILGDMFELGEKEVQYHALVGSYAAEKGIDVIICVGKLSEAMYHGALEANKNSRIYYFAAKEEMLSALRDILKPGDSILVKASHGMHFEKVVEFLKAL
jgi:UDP-N-acetylmuramoyl-tripeptide--D-alanyl-D-alanine ligase